MRSTAPARLADKVRQIGGGLNPAGYPDEYIAYTYNPALRATSNNYKELMKDFMGSWLANARDTYNAAQGIQRDFESSTHAVTAATGRDQRGLRQAGRRSLRRQRVAGPRRAIAARAVGRSSTRPSSW